MHHESQLSKVEQLLSNNWGGDVHLSFQAGFEEHPHVARLTVTQAPPSCPSTVILKRWRVEGEERYDPDISPIGLFNDWASLEFLANVMGSETCAPHVYAADEDAGLIVVEDLSSEYSLGQALWKGNAAEATQALMKYGQLLGLLHGRTAGQLDLYIEIRKRLSSEFDPHPQNYFESFQGMVADLRSVAIEVPPSAFRDIQDAAALLSQPGNFTAFTHGDPVFGNIITKQNRWYLIDFEAARLRHALYEGVYPRMLFPTSGVLYVQRIPEQVWRQAEEAYRTTLSEFLPAAKDNSRYGPAMTAACAYWLLGFCGGWLKRAIGDEFPPGRLSHLRRCIIARSELFIETTQEFQCMNNLGEFLASLVHQWRSHWLQTEYELPLYPAFLRTVSQ